MVEDLYCLWLGLDVLWAYVVVFSALSNYSLGAENNSRNYHDDRNPFRLVT